MSDHCRCGPGIDDQIVIPAQVLARQGHALDRLLAQHAAKDQDGVAAHVLLWRSHDELRDAIQNIFRS